MLSFEYKKKLTEVAIIPEAINCLLLTEDTEDEEDRYAKSEHKVFLPLVRVGLYALTQERSFIADVMDYFDGLSNDDDLSPYYTRRPDSKELFSCLRLLNEDCLWIVLERIKDLSIVDIGNLRTAILNNDINVVRSIIYEKEVNIGPITPVCRLLYIKIRIDDLNKRLEETAQQVDSLSDEEFKKSGEMLKEFLFQYAACNHEIANDLRIHKGRTPFLDIHFENCERSILDDEFDLTGEQPSIRDLVIRNLKQAYPTFVEDGFSLNEYTDNNYKGVLCVYCLLKSVLPSLNTIAKVVMEGILKAEEFRTIWSRFELFDKNTFDVLEKECDAYFLKHGIPINEDSPAEEESPSTPQIGEPQEKTDRSNRKPSSRDPEIQDFKDSTPDEKAKVLIPIIEELLDRLKGKEDAFLADCDLQDLKDIFGGILTGSAKEHGAVQIAIIDELSGTGHREITSQYYYKDRLWVLPFFIIIGRLFKKEVLKGGQTAFVKALFPDKRVKDPQYGIVHKEENDFIEACRAKVSLGNTIETSKDSTAATWRDYIAWIDECVR